VPMSKPKPQVSPEATTAARNLLRSAGQGALATLDRHTGHPHASLVATATEPDGTPLLLISRLAVHTQNLIEDQRASLLLTGAETDGDPLAAPRITLIGTAAPTSSQTARRRFLARHPLASSYAGFADFHFYSLLLDRAHYVGGFGRIIDMNPLMLLEETGDASTLVDAEASLADEINRTHAADLAGMAARFGGAAGRDWKLIGVDPGGIDLLGGQRVLRIDFAERVCDAEAARTAILRLFGR